jgi:hypothetical protein
MQDAGEIQAGSRPEAGGRIVFYAEPRITHRLGGQQSTAEHTAQQGKGEARARPKRNTRHGWWASTIEAMARVRTDTGSGEQSTLTAHRRRRWRRGSQLDRRGSLDPTFWDPA